MKILKNLFVSSILFTLAVNVQAKSTFQAGDIREGKTYLLTLFNGPASYYKDGTAGNLSFKCYLNGGDTKAALYPGKNFSLNMPAVLTPGENGPFTWTLRNMGYQNGNIKVLLLNGIVAEIRCWQTN